jgi:hypothetical protein
MSAFHGLGNREVEISLTLENNLVSSAEWAELALSVGIQIPKEFRVGILKQNAKSWYSGIPGIWGEAEFKEFFCPTIFLKHCVMPALCSLFILPG